MTGQSQKHGFIWENNIRETVFLLSSETNDTNIHDIPCDQNPFDSNENISIKTTGSNTIYCGDILRFFNYNFNTHKNTILVIKYRQISGNKTIQNIYEIDQHLHKIDRKRYNPIG